MLPLYETFSRHNDFNNMIFKEKKKKTGNHLFHGIRIIFITVSNGETFNDEKKYANQQLGVLNTYNCRQL